MIKVFWCVLPFLLASGLFVAAMISDRRRTRPLPGEPCLAGGELVGHTMPDGSLRLLPGFRFEPVGARPVEPVRPHHG